MTRTPATRRAVSDVLAHGLRGDLAHSAVGVELGQLLQSGITADMSAGARRGEIVGALREACGQDPVVYTRLVELVFVAGLDELELLVELPDSATSRGSRSCRRRRRGVRLAGVAREVAQLVASVCRFDSGDPAWGSMNEAELT